MATIYNSKSLVYKKLDSFPAGTEISTITGEISALCQRIIQYSLSAVDHLGENGANLIQDGCTVMMHSYSSALMSVFTAAAKQGKRFSLICTESRPLRESRVAAKILQELHVPVTYVTDASHLGVHARLRPHHHGGGHHRMGRLGRQQDGHRADLPARALLQEAGLHRQRNL